MGLVDKIFEHEREGYYGEYGGAFIPEILRTTLDELIDVFDTARRDPAFWPEFQQVMQTYYRQIIQCFLAKLGHGAIRSLPS